MKRLLWISVMLLLVSNVFCQKLESGSLACLKGEKQLNVIIDFSQCKIDGFSEQDFIWKMSLQDSRGAGWEEYWKNDCYRSFLGKFCLNAYEETQEIDLKLGSFPDAKYTAVLQLSVVDDDGEIYGNIKIEETETGKLMAVIIKVNGDGGRWGSLENLIGDAMERAGKKIGKFICSNVSQISNQVSDVEQVQTGQSTNDVTKRLAIRFPEVLSKAYNAFRISSIYNMSKTEKASVEQDFVSEIINDLKNAVTWEDLEIINTKIKYLDQYSAIQQGLKETVNLLKDALREKTESFENQ